VSAARAIRLTAGTAVAALAVIAGAVSYAHMKVLAERHGESGWRAHAFPLSVDGIEIVASLVLLADRRVGRRSGWLVWAALAAGTAASVAANVAVSATDPVGRVVAGWPAFALLVAIKLLSGLLDEPAGTVSAVRTDAEVAADGSGRPSSGAGTADGYSKAPGPSTATDPDDLAALLPVALAVQASATADGQRMTRAALAEGLRSRGVAVSNARLSALRQALAAAVNGSPPGDHGGGQP
jgi:Protein of unknown function (DUF2637)